MSVLLLLPGIISLFLVLQRRISTAFLSVYLPCLLLLPQEYSFRIPHLPPFSAAELALIPLGAVGLFRLLRSRSFALMDLLVVLFVASVGLSEILHEPVRNNGILAALDAFVSILLAYAVGRQLIEPRLRLATIRRFVILVLLNFVPGLYEWRMGQNPYATFGKRFFGASFQFGAGVQIRSGRGRLAGAFDDAEIAGIGYAMTFCLNAWLVYLRRIKASVSLGKRLTALERYHVPGLVLLLCAWLTQSRGPLIALAAGYLFIYIPRFKNMKLMLCMVGFILIAGYLATSAYFRSYTDVVGHYAIRDEAQGSAVYRREMNQLYAPIAEAGGWTGWSMMAIPVVRGMRSIDNQFLLVHLAWGRLAYTLFLLITWESIRVALVRAWRFTGREDRAFALSLLAALVVLWLALLTVFMGEQLPQISFLLIGWIQSMAPGTPATRSGTTTTHTRSESTSFRPVFS